MTCSSNGDAPNMRDNDGARLLPLADTDYRHYRPSIQLASVLFHCARAYPGEGDWGQPIHWLGLGSPEQQLAAQHSAQFGDGGYFVLRQKPVMALLRYRFRPSKAEVPHFDFG